MPQRPLHHCSRPGCHVLVRERWCPAHKTDHHRQDRATRGDARTVRLYDWEWRKYRNAYLAEHPLCVECQAGVPLPGGVKPAPLTPATVVDHVRPHKGDRLLFWMPENHRAVCKPHHDARVDEGDFGRANP